MNSAKIRRIAPALLIPFAVGALYAQTDTPNQVPAKRPLNHHIGAAPRATGRPGDPLPDLTPDQLADFSNGLDQFENIETAESGLGPIYNNTSCGNCHSSAALGGASAATVTRFGHGDKVFDPLTQLGGSLLQSQAIDYGALERIPPEASVIAQRKTPPLFGAGLIEAIPDQDIQNLVKRKKADGVVGRAATVEDTATGETRVGRFGWKAQLATLLTAAADEYQSELGITNRLFPKENAPNGNHDLLAQYDRISDPEDTADSSGGKASIDRVTDFMRYLAPPPQPRPSAETQEGLALFSRLGCAECHVQTLTTGPSQIRALDHKPVMLFSDLLLHDMGSLNDGIGQGDALPNEMKTAPLWGLRFRAPYLHDGRAPSIADAILAHDGEAAPSRDRFNKLSASQQRQFCDFLRGL